jgi:glycosyltransferase involved in cell wall biosynthesis
VTAAAAPGGPLPTFSILIETENLADADPAALGRCLAALEAQNVSPDEANEVLLLDSGDAPADLLASLRRRHPWIDVARIGEASDYYEAKAKGAERVTGEVLVLCDSDCTYDPAWLGALLEPFAGSPGVQVVTGETTTPIDGPYGLAMALTYIFPRWSRSEGLVANPGYDTNNVAIRREFLARHPIPLGLPIYRGNHVVQARTLLREGHTIWRQPRARALHPLPEGASYFCWRFLLLGDEALTIGRLSRGDGAATVRSFSAGALFVGIAGGRIKGLAQRARAVVAEDRRHLVRLPLAVPLAAAATLLYWLGLLISFVSPGTVLSAYRRAHPA